MKLFYRTVKKAIFNENKELVYVIKKKWTTVYIFDVSQNTIAKFKRKAKGYLVTFENQEYLGKHSLTNVIEFDCGINIKGGSFFRSPCASCVIKQADKIIAKVSRDRGRMFFQECEIEISDAPDEKSAIAFLFPAIETLLQN